MKQIFTIARQSSSPLITIIITIIITTTIESFQEDDNHFNLQLSYKNNNITAIYLSLLNPLIFYLIFF